MTEDEVRAVVSRVLGRRFPGGEYQDSDVRFETDFDGAPIIRVTAHYRSRPGTRAELINSVHAIQDALLPHREDRYVFLTHDIADERQVHADTD